ncbi:activator-dependent family glycosyltransferase [Streptomyces sp. RS10V-4]|uniref:activator-dependent family glycosyltransferase n=1 Tax=Streptomyces rhizoryzae TaxID=2932493 RepID=UPI0020058360|nr:activator-dependent family glycosyltransferase [Streptomyces rhizoryzae]MCK7624209.1 activator-dependent family glycosyltransferase [Streptomyces rhizoryzae]
MRVLFTAAPGTSIFLSMVPLAWALRTAGHEVRFASQPRFADEITRAGLTAVPVGRNYTLSRVMEWAGIDPFEGVRADLPPPWDVVNDPAGATFAHLLKGCAAQVEDIDKPENFPLVAGLVDFARAWRPDLVIWEPFTYAGAIAAKASGAAHARLLWGLDVFGATREHFLRLKAEQPAHARPDPLAEWLGGYARKYGGEFTEDMTTGHFTIDQFPGCLQLEAGHLEYVRMQYVAYNGPASVPKWLWATPARPRVALTMGLTATDLFDGYTINTQDVLDSLADLDIEVVATIADEEKAKLRRIPDNARLLPFVPLHALAPTCSVVIHHAGPGTIGTVARHGVPQLSVPYSFDEPILARRLTERGAGLELPHGKATGQAVREHVLRLLNEPEFRAGAAALRDEMLALPTPNALVPRLEELTARHRPAA